MILSLKDVHKGETAFLIGGGKTTPIFDEVVDNYDGVFIGVNQAYSLPNTGKKLDYLFIETIITPDIIEALDQMMIFHCSKLKINHPNAYTYREDIYEVFRRCHAGARSFGGVSTSAFHAFFFAVYIGCSKIYLVGTDCNKTSFYGNPNDYSICKPGWEDIKLRLTAHYPNIEIISINPVGLKNVFPYEHTSNMIFFPTNTLATLKSLKLPPINN